MDNDLTGWFAVRTMYRNDLNVGRYLEAQGAEVFIPMHYVDVKRGGAVRQVLEPVVRNIVFTRTCRSLLDRVKKELESKWAIRLFMNRETHEPILTDWRAEAARPFYEATPSHHGDIVMRRHITLNFREVVGVEDEVLDVHSEQVGKASSAGTLTGEGALLASLSSRRTGKMTDIVATIQAEQDRIIRSDLGHAVVVQGGPGTGKTAVALHRAAYLLYTHRSMLDRSGVLVIGPSSAFLHYIDQVLPSLGETGVVSRTIADLIPGFNATATDTPRAAQLKGEQRMAKAIANAVAARERVPRTLPVVRINGFAVAMKPSDVEQAIADARRTRQPHNKARETFVRSMLEALRARYVEQLDYTPEQPELTDVMQQLRMNDTGNHDECQQHQTLYEFPMNLHNFVF